LSRGTTTTCRSAILSLFLDSDVRGAEVEMLRVHRFVPHKPHCNVHPTARCGERGLGEAEEGAQRSLSAQHDAGCLHLHFVQPCAARTQVF
jgi:hypothetical protein